MARRRLYIHGLAAVIALLVGCAGPQRGAGGGGGFLAALEGKTPREVAAGMFSRYDADQRRRSINRVADAPWGGQPPYVRAYRLLLHDPDATVRAAAVRALARHGTPADAERIAPLLEDQAAIVRWEAAEALRRLHNPAAVDALLASLRTDPEPDVRRAAAAALAQYPQPRVFQALVGALADDSYAVIRRAARSLHTLTGRSFGEDDDAWLAWADRTEDLFADRQPYQAPRYDPPRGLFESMIF